MRRVVVPGGISSFFGVLIALLFVIAVSGCTPQATCIPSKAPSFRLGQARFRLPEASMPKIFSDQVDRTEVVVGGTRTARYCISGDVNAVVADSVSVSFTGLRPLAQQQPLLAKTYNVIWRSGPGSVPLPPDGASGATLSDGIVRYGAPSSGAYSVYINHSTDWSGPINGRCGGPATPDGKTSCRLTASAAGEFGIDVDLLIEDAPPSEWAAIVRSAAQVLRDSKL